MFHLQTRWFCDVIPLQRFLPFRQPLSIALQPLSKLLLLPDGYCTSHQLLVGAFYLTGELQLGG